MKSKKIYIQTYLQSRNRFIDLENRVTVTNGEGGRREMDWEYGIDMYTLLYLKQTVNKGFLYSTGNSAQYSEIA